MIDTTAPDAPPAARPGPPAPSSRWWDVLAPLAFVALAIVHQSALWRSPNTRVSALSPSDPALLEWMLSHAAQAITDLRNPFFTDQLNTPDGVNLMANASILGIGVLLAPFTLLFGPAVTYVLATTIGLAGTAIGWYFLLSREIVTSRGAAAVGAGLAGFGPPMLSQSNGHLQMAFQVLVPLIVWQVLRLLRTTRPIRDGLVLAALVVGQYFIGAEVLLITALACTILAISYAAMRPRALWARRGPAIRALVTCALASGVALAYPLRVQFFGPQVYHQMPNIPERFGADVISWFRYTGTTVGGDPRALLDGTAPLLAPNVTEINTFFGVPLLALLLISSVWLWRRSLAARLAAITTWLFALFSLGVTFVVNDHDTGVPAPWWPLGHLPLLGNIVPTRLAHVAAVGAAVLVALTIDRALAVAPSRWYVRYPALVAVVVALVPLFPRPTPIVHVPAAPPFLASGAYQRYLANDQALMITPAWKQNRVNAMRWSARDHLGFGVSDGYYLVPDPRSTEGMARYSTPPSNTDNLLSRLASAGKPMAVTAEQRAQAPIDLRDEEVGIVFLPATTPRAAVARANIEKLLGHATAVDGGWIWQPSELD